MQRRALLSLFATLTGAAEATQAKAESTPARARVVYHLADPDKVTFVLGNIRNHYKGMDGPENVEIALVVHGPSLRSFRLDGNNGNIRADLAQLHAKGLSSYACQNTLDGMGLKLGDLLPGFRSAEKGGVVKLAEFQGQGYAYLRP